jgi:hypothetical protein
MPLILPAATAASQQPRDPDDHQRHGQWFGNLRDVFGECFEGRIAVLAACTFPVSDRLSLKTTISEYKEPRTRWPERLTRTNRQSAQVFAIAFHSLPTHWTYHPERLYGKEVLLRA